MERFQCVAGVFFPKDGEESGKSLLPLKFAVRAGCLLIEAAALLFGLYFLLVSRGPTAKSLGQIKASLAVRASVPGDIDGAPVFESSPSVSSQTGDEAGMSAVADGYLYRIAEGKVYVFDVHDPRHMKFLSSITHGAGLLPCALLTDGDELVVFSNGGADESRTEADRYDVKNRSKPLKTLAFLQDGQFGGAAESGGCVYLVTVSSGAGGVPGVGAPGREKPVKARSVYLPKGYAPQGFTVVSRLTVGGGRTKTVAVLGRDVAAYFSDRVYLAAKELTKSGGLFTLSTEIFKFGTGLDFEGEASADGELYAGDCLYEENGRLCAVTEVAKPGRALPESAAGLNAGTPAMTSCGLCVFDRRMKPVFPEDFYDGGPYRPVFTGGRAYLIRDGSDTQKLRTVDLADPQNSMESTVVGATGSAVLPVLFDEKLFPLGDGFICAVADDYLPKGSRTAFALYDVRDEGRPVLSAVCDAGPGIPVDEPARQFLAGLKDGVAGITLQNGAEERFCLIKLAPPTAVKVGGIGFDPGGIIEPAAMGDTASGGTVFTFDRLKVTAASLRTLSPLGTVSPDE